MQTPYITLRNNEGKDNIDFRDRHFSIDIYRNLLSLDYSEEQSLMSKGIKPIFEQVECLEPTSFPVQVHPSLKFREGLIKFHNISTLKIDKLVNLPEKTRTENMDKLVRWIKYFDSYCQEKQYRIITLLNRMGFYDISLKLIPDLNIEDIKKNLFLARIAAKKQMALYKTGKIKDNKILEVLAESKFEENYIKLGAAISLLVHNAKLNNLEQAKYWGDLAKREYTKLENNPDPIAILQSSIFFRAYAYIPFLKGQQDELDKYMDLAYSKALEFPKIDTNHRLIYLENLHPIYETSIKISFWKKDFKKALYFAKKLKAIDPLEPKVYLHLGDCYRMLNNYESAKKAYMKCFNIGYPFSGYSAYLIGYCFERLQDLKSACHWYCISLEYEPYSISVLERLELCSLKAGIPELNSYARNSISCFKKIKKRVSN